MDYQQVILVLLSISYVIVWSVSFYFQLFLMIKLKSSEGYSIDFQIFNLVGFTYYTVSNIHYLQSNNIDFSSVMDLIFSTHALLISIVLFILTFVYPRKQNQGSHGPLYMVIILILGAVVYYFLNKNVIEGKPSDLWIFMGMGKAIISTLKYLYQIFLNKDRQETKGFSIINVFLDFMGGTLSLIQVILQIIFNSNDFLGDKTNIPKFALSLCVMIFDIILMYQHFFIYKKEDGYLDMQDTKEMQKLEDQIDIKLKEN